jgi:putative ABC transport system permease protein
MMLRMMKKDLSHNKIVAAALCLFVLLSATLAASAASVIMQLTGSLNSLFGQASAPHFVQMHAGELKQEQIDAFTESEPLVKAQQTVEMINIDSTHLFWGEHGAGQPASVMDNAFVRQNDTFDFLLDLNNRIIAVSAGEIGVPVYYMQRNDLRIGDQLRIASGSFEQVFTITAFVRDVQMNPSLVSSKRFVISDSDWQALKGHFADSEYLIEFQLASPGQVSEFAQSYQASKLPQTGPVITYALFQTLNALTDGVVAAVIILVCLLLMAIAGLCLRFTLTATMEEDYREIGVMKAIGITSARIQQFYLLKYVALAAIACAGGYLVSLWASRLFGGNIALYMGQAERTASHYFIPLLAALLVFVAMVCMCMIVLRKFKRITAVEALRLGAAPDGRTGKPGLALHNNRIPYVNMWLGLKDVYTRYRMFGLLGFVFVICACLLIVPILFLHTVQSPQFTTYMGAGKSDLRIDFRQAAGLEEQHENLVAQLEREVCGAGDECVENVEQRSDT